MKLTDIIRVEPKKWGNLNIYRALFGGAGVEFDACGNSRESALDNLIKAIREQLRYRNDRVYIFAKDGTLFHLYYSRAWQYDIVRASEPTYVGGCLLGDDISGDAAHKMMLAHIDQYNEGLDTVASA